MVKARPGAPSPPLPICDPAGAEGPRLQSVPGGDSFHIEIRERPVSLPDGAPLSVISRALAQAVAAEWQTARRAGPIDAARMPLTALAATAQQRVRPRPYAMVDTLLPYAQTDLLCYRVDHPPTLAEAQAATWQPWLDWAERHHHAPLVVTTGIAHAPQPRASIAQLRSALAALSPEELAALGVAIPALGSCVLGLALIAGAIDPAAAVAASLLEQEFTEQRWGVDADAVARRAFLVRDVELAARFMELSRDSERLRA